MRDRIERLDVPGSDSEFRFVPGFEISCCSEFTCWRWDRRGVPARTISRISRGKSGTREGSPSWLIRIGMLAYDVLSFDKSVAWHRILSARAVRERFTGMSAAGLSGAALFTDGQVEYAERLCVELAIAAAGAGAVIRTHERVIGLVSEQGRVVGVRTQTRDGAEGELRASVVINAAGPWVDRVNDVEGDGTEAAPRLIGGSKGSHIVVDPFPGAPTSWPSGLRTFRPHADQAVIVCRSATQSAAHRSCALFSANTLHQIPEL